MPRPSNDHPTYLKHSTGQAFCRVRLANGKRKDVYLGSWKSKASKDEYARVLGIVAANHGIYPDAAANADLSVAEAMVRYLRFVESHYGEKSNTVTKIKYAMGPFKKLFAPTLIADFGPIHWV